FLATYAYYRSSFVFLQRADAAVRIESFDDDALRGLRVVVDQAARAASPPALALANRGLVDRQLRLVRDGAATAALAAPVVQVAAGNADVGILWGPVAGYFASLQSVPLTVTPVQPEFDLPFLPMVFPIAIGVRPGDEALRDRLNVALAARWGEIRSLLAEYRVPLLDLPRPTPTAPTEPGARAQPTAADRPAGGGTGR
ncbi:MAG TPA: hypothetical protein VM491_14910, partial [Burkholderiaceae bacterium]|nr:hypothetical protein [Burkholderiaceae bacterium]